MIIQVVVGSISTAAILFYGFFLTALMFDGKRVNQGDAVRPDNVRAFPKKADCPQIPCSDSPTLRAA